MEEQEELKQRVTLHILAQLRAMTDTERGAFVDKMLGFLTPESLIALDFSYAMTPGQARGSAGAEPVVVDVEALRTELLALTALRRRAVRENDVVGRLFASLRQDTTPPPSWDDLQRAGAELERKVPGFIVYYVKEGDMFTLAPDVTYTEQRQDAPETTEQEPSGTNKPYTCHECGAALTFPETFFLNGLTFCSEHLPDYDKHQQF